VHVPDASAPAGLDSARARALASKLRAAAAGLIATIESINPQAWDQFRKPGEWSPGKDAEHVTDANALHFWRVCSALGLDHPEPPEIERAQLTASRSQAEIVATLRSRIEHCAGVIGGLTDAQLDVVDTTSRSVADVIERPLIRHLETHREQIEKKLRALRR
jgi:DinB superfamily